MAIYANTLNNYFNENYNEEKVKELLEGIIVDPVTLQEKIKYVTTKYNLPTEDIKRCIFYGRVSTESKQQASSIINQHDIAEQFEQDYIHGGYIVVEEVFERETATVASKRKKFMSIVKRAKKTDRNFDFIAVKAVDRMFRNVDDTILIMRELKEVGVGLLFYYDNLNSLVEKDRNEIIDKANKAEAYSNNLSRNVRMGMSRHYRNGDGRFSSYAFGYDKPSVNNAAVVKINEEEAELVRELYNRYAYNGDNLGEITTDWRARGIKTKLGKEINTVGLRRILTNRLYTGVLLNGRRTRESIRDDFTQLPEEEWKTFDRPDLRIVSDELFNAVQKRIQKEKFGHQHMLAVTKDRLFKSMIKCPVCGKNFKQIKNGHNSNGEWNLYYTCSSHKQKTRNANILDCSNLSSFRKDEMLQVLSLYFQEILENRDDIEQLVRNSVESILSKNVTKDNKKDYSKEINELNAKLKRETQLFRDGIVENTTELKKLKKEIEKLKTQQNIEEQTTKLDYDVDKVMSELFTSISDLVETGMKEETLDAVKFNLIFDSIIATPDNRLIFNIKASRNITETMKNKGLESVSEISTFIPPTELEKIKVLNSIYTEEQLKLVDEQRRDLCFVPCEQLFDLNKLCDTMNSIRNSSSEFRRRYRYCERYKGLGKTILDSVNIVL